MKSNKKGAMELGIGTVVMLVIAIVIIGAGIAFIRGFFQTGESSLTGAFDIVEFRVEPTRTNPLVISTGTELNIAPEQRLRLGIGYFNKDSATSFRPKILCTNGTDENLEELDLLVSAQTIGSGEIGTFETIITAPEDQDYYSCVLEMYESPIEDDSDPVQSSQFIMNVRN